MPTKAHRKLQKHAVLKFSSNQNEPQTADLQQTVETQENQSILHRIWQSMDKSAILSAVIIGLPTLLKTKLYKVYTYVYWLPYFKMLKVDTQYSDIASFDMYEDLVKYVPYYILAIIFYLIFDLLLKKVKNDVAKIVFYVADVVLYIVIMIWAMFGNVSNYKFLCSICFALALVLLKRGITMCSSKKKNRSLSSNSVVAWVLILLLFFGLMVYINGYNTNVVDLLVGDVRTIDDNKMVVFETDDQYYVIAFEKNEDGSIKLFRNSYAFADKEKQSVVKKHFNKIYNESDKSLDDVKFEFLDIVW